MSSPSCPICKSGQTQWYAERVGYSYRLCHDCTHVFLFPTPSAKQISGLYHDNYVFKVNTQALARFKQLSRDVLKTLRTLYPAGKSLLDIGTGYGTFVEVARANGFDATGIEPALNLYSVAKQTVGKHVIHTSLHAFSKPDKRRFDFVSLIHVVEHLQDPPAELKTILRLLKPGGVLYIETPNIDSHLSRTEKENYTFLTPPDHINLFSNRSLRTLLVELDPSLEIKTTTYSYPEHLVGVLRQIKQKFFTHQSRKTVSQPLSYDRVGRTGSTETGAQLNFFDSTIAPLLTPLLNVGNQGSTLQLFIKKPDQGKELL